MCVCVCASVGWTCEEGKCTISANANAYTAYNLFMGCDIVLSGLLAKGTTEAHKYTNERMKKRSMVRKENYEW